jgi:DNA-3-methyladenine glycosylase II
VRAMDHRARSAHLCAIWGIGQWTADMVSIFYRRDEDVWPAGDASVQRIFAKFIGRRQPVKAAQRFAPHRSILALHMWRLLDGPPS